MAEERDEDNPGRVFTLFEANQLIPQLQTHLETVKQFKSILLQTREEVRKASDQALYGGNFGSPIRDQPANN
jgi:hypothetical protein